MSGGERLRLSRVQHFSVGDGDGIRTTVFLAGCNLRCPWCHNPETVYVEQAAVSEDLALRPRLVTADSLMGEILADREFYEESGGGVTLSGGEPLLQAEALVPLCRLLKAEGIHITVDTAGCVPYRQFAILDPYVDEYLVDIKTATPPQYRESVQGDLSLLCENIRCLQADGKRLRVRIPLIPGFNTSSHQLAALGQLCRSLAIERVEPLRFHRMGKGKYLALGVPYAYSETPTMSDEEFRQAKQQLLAYL